VITSPLVPLEQREVPDKQIGNQSFIRTDNHLSDSHSLFVRYRRDTQKEIGNGIGGLNTRERGSDTIETDQDIVGSHTAVLSARVLNELRVQFGRHYADIFVYMPIDSPTINRPSGNFGKASNLPQGRTEDRLEIVDNFSYSFGAHDMKFGVDYNRIRANSYFNNNTGGTFTFSTDKPFDPADLSTYPIQYTQNIGDPTLFRPNDEYGVFAQDSWRALSNLTFNVGLRYDHENAFEKAVGVADGNLNLAPRFGFAWDPFKNQKTVVRGGAGLYYSKVFLNITGNIMLARHFVGVTVIDPGFPDPFSRGEAAPPSSPSTTIAPDEVRTPVTRQLSLGVKRELRAGFAVSVDVVNSRGRNLYNAPDVNAPDPATGLRPDPDFLRVTQYQTTGNSWYSGLLLGVEKRTGPGPQIGISYTLSKQTRDVEDFGFTAQDNFNRAAEKGPADNDRRHQLVTNIVWALPWGVQIGAFAQARSALPWTVTTGVDNNKDSRINDRPDLANPGGDPLDKATYSSSFTGRVGNLGRNTNRGTGYFEVHLRGSKFINLRRQKLDQLELFVEALNVTNHDNFGDPNGNLRSSAFGTATDLATGATPRQVEIGFRLNF
jgi:hypothetical protein